MLTAELCKAEVIETTLAEMGHDVAVTYVGDGWVKLAYRTSGSYVYGKASEVIKALDERCDRAGAFGPVAHVVTMANPRRKPEPETPAHVVASMSRFYGSVEKAREAFKAARAEARRRGGDYRVYAAECGRIDVIRDDVFFRPALYNVGSITQVPGHIFL